MPPSEITTPLAKRGMSALAATGGLHIGSGLPKGGVISHAKAAAWSSPEVARLPPREGIVPASAPATHLDVAPRAGTAVMKPRRDMFLTGPPVSLASS